MSTEPTYGGHTLAELREMSERMKVDNEMLLRLHAEVERLQKLIHLAQANCGIPDAGDACRAVLKTLEQA